MINRSTGELLIGSLTIGPRSTHVELTDFLQRAEISWKNNWLENGTNQLWFGNAFSDGHYYSGTIYFRSESIDMILFCVGREKLESDPWTNWSEERELEKAKYMKEWLSSYLGEQSKFNWGTTWSGYDAKGASAGIGIRYVRRDA